MTKLMPHRPRFSWECSRHDTWQYTVWMMALVHVCCMIVKVFSLTTFVLLRHCRPFQNNKVRQNWWETAHEVSKTRSINGDELIVCASGSTEAKQSKAKQSKAGSQLTLFFYVWNGSPLHDWMSRRFCVWVIWTKLVLAAHNTHGENTFKERGENKTKRSCCDRLFCYVETWNSLLHIEEL